jgi:AcrR family transcriptional regulator
MATGKTRDRILDAALRLFNEEGLPAVSTHRIAADLEISSGNLHYHFKSKRHIATWLFRRFEDRLTPCIQASASATALDDVWLSLQLTFEANSDYRFILRDMEHMLHENPELESRARTLTARQLLAAQALCARLVQNGVINASGEDIEMLALQMVLTITYWYSFNRLIRAPGAKSANDTGLAAYYTLTLLSPFVVGESRAYLNFLRSKFLK